MMNEAAQKFAEYENMKAKTIKNFCRGFGDCEGCPFFIEDSEYYPDCMLLALVPDHWILAKEGENEE